MGASVSKPNSLKSVIAMATKIKVQTNEKIIKLTNKITKLHLEIPQINDEKIMIQSQIHNLSDGTQNPQIVKIIQQSNLKFKKMNKSLQEKKNILKKSQSSLKHSYRLLSNVQKAEKYIQELNFSYIKKTQPPAQNLSMLQSNRKLQPLRQPLPKGTAAQTTATAPAIAKGTAAQTTATARQPFSTLQQRKLQPLRQPFSTLQQRKPQPLRQPLPRVQQRKPQPLRQSFSRVQQRKPQPLRASRFQRYSANVQ